MNKTSSENLQDELASDVLELPSGDAKIRWTLLTIFSVTLPLIVILLLIKQPEHWWFAAIPLFAWGAASIFPDRELDLKNRTVIFHMRFLQKVTVFSWQWPITDAHAIQIHAQAYGSPGQGNHGWVHKVVCAENRRRITLQDFILKSASPDSDVEDFGKLMSEALKLPYEGYIQKPGFFWH